MQISSRRRRSARLGYMTTLVSAAAIALLPFDAQLAAAQDPTHDTGTGDADSGIRDEEGYERPDLRAAPALVRIEAHASVTVQALRGFPFDLNKTFTVDDPAADRTGFYINSNGYVVTSAAQQKQRRRFAVWAINQAVREEFPGSLPRQRDAFEEVRSGNPEAEQALQECYQWRRSGSTCDVRVRSRNLVVPYAADGEPETLRVRRRAGDEMVAFYDVSFEEKPDGYLPVTVLLNQGQPGDPFWALAACREELPCGVSIAEEPPPPGGTFSEDLERPLPEYEATAIGREFGPTAAGAPLISRTGAVIGMLVPSGRDFVALPADHLLEDAQAGNIGLDSTLADHHLDQALRALESGNYDGAVGYLEDASSFTENQTVLVELAEFANTRSSQTGDTVGPRDAVSDVKGSASTFPWLVVGATLVVLAGVSLLIARRRYTRSSRAPASGSPLESDQSRVHVSPTPQGAQARNSSTARPVLREPESGVQGRQGEGADVSPRHERPAARGMTTIIPSMGSSHGKAESAASAAVYCVSCGSEISPGDRFCFSCGAPARSRE